MLTANEDRGLSGSFWCCYCVFFWGGGGGGEGVWKTKPYNIFLSLIKLQFRLKIVDDRDEQKHRILVGVGPGL